ncbi:MAG: hypothetical protein INR68_18230, partial [Methylobacterium mesophilicum]|nr:hypothetical protein [Methylobacterium mesophilicum]
MARGKLLFRQSDLSRAIKALQGEGLEIYRTTIHPDGTISIDHQAGKTELDPDEEYQRW